MIGQGRPSQSRARVARLARAMLWLSCGALAVGVLLWPSQAWAEEARLQVRIAWGGGAERIWHGSIRLTGGRFSDLQALGIEADESGSIWLDGGGIEVRTRSVRAYDGVDVWVSGDLDQRLIVSLSNEPGEATKPLEITLRSLLSQSHTSNLDEIGNRLLVSRAPSDRLRVNFDRQHLVFAPGDTFQFEIQPYLLESSGGGLHYQTRLT
jgi:hypothetical protein